MDGEAGTEGRLSSRHVTEGQLRAPVVGGARIVTAVGGPSDTNLICARRPDRKTEWRIGATNPTSDERAKFARQFGQTFGDILTHAGGMYEKLRYAVG